MKTEAEIRAHRDVLRASMQKSCGCRGTEHEFGCFVGGRMMVANERLLSWILGECPDHQECVDELARRNREDVP